MTNEAQPPPNALATTLASDTGMRDGQPIATSKKTMIGVSFADVVPQGIPGAPQVAPQVAPPPAQDAGMRPPAAKTMLGVAFPGIAPVTGAGTPQPQAAPMPAAPMPPAPMPPAPATPMEPPAMQAAPSQADAARNNKTMLGVAMPGIAPTHTAPVDPLRSAKSGTMVGVAVPGIAPLQAGAPAPAPMQHAPHAPVQVKPRLMNTAIAQAPILPMPPPFVEDEPPPPSAPLMRARAHANAKGVPIGVVIGIIGGLVLVGGTIIAVLYKGSSPIHAQPRLDAQGNEQLHLKCDNCKDGTTAELDGATATFAGNEADLTLSKPLEVGDNPLTVHIDRPGVGRDEAVSLVVPVAFRIRADLADIGAKPPVITVRVAAAPGTDFKVDGKPLALDPSGKGAYALDVSADTEGVTDETRIIDRKIPYTVTLKGSAPENGVVSARTAVVPLRLESPSSHAVIDQGRFTVAGQTQPGGAVTLNDKPVTMNADGTFAQSFDAPTLGDVPIEIRASAPSRAPRTAHVVVKRVTSLDAEARAADGQSLLTYDAVNADPAAKVGQRAAIAGDVVEARVVSHEMIALVDDRRGCAQKATPGACLARVIAGEDVKMARGDSVRVYGRVTRAVTASNGKVVPEIEADFVISGKGRARR